MGRRGRDDLDASALLVAAQRAGDVLPPVVEEARARPHDAPEVHLRTAMPGGLAAGPTFLALAEPDHPVEMLEIAGAQRRSPSMASRVGLSESVNGACTR